jgi:hypothetical protein
MAVVSTDLATNLLVGFALIFVPASALTVITLGGGQWIRRRASASGGAFQHAVRWLHHGFALAPVLWILAAATLLARAYAEVGEWPRPGRVGFLTDTPSNIPAEAFGAHHAAALALFMATWISLIAFPPLHFAAKQVLGARALLWFVGWLVTWLAGLLLSVYEGPYGIAEWIL